MRFILPLLLALVGLGGGIGAGLFLSPEEAPKDMALADCPPPADGEEIAQSPPPIPTKADHGDDHAEDEANAAFDYVKLNNQFVVPVVKEGRVAALVVMSLSVEVETGAREAVFLREPKLRDTFLQVLFDHANSGGFDGNFTSTLNLTTLRQSLVYAAQSILGSTASDVLIQDIARQDT